MTDGNDPGIKAKDRLKISPQRAADDVFDNVVENHGFGIGFGVVGEHHMGLVLGAAGGVDSGFDVGDAQLRVGHTREHQGNVF